MILRMADPSWLMKITFANRFLTHLLKFVLVINRSCQVIRDRLRIATLMR